MLMPKRVKYRKQHRGRRRGKASGGNFVNFGDFGLQALESCWMTANQIESARIAMNRYVRRTGKIWIRIFPDKPFTKKPAETRMGSGKGAPEGWVAVVKPGRILFEMAGVSEEQAREAMRLASHKLPIAVKFVRKADQPAREAEEPETEAVSAEGDGLAASGLAAEVPSGPEGEPVDTGIAETAAAGVAERLPGGVAPAEGEETASELSAPAPFAEDTEITDGGA